MTYINTANTVWPAPYIVSTPTISYPSTWPVPAPTWSIPTTSVIQTVAQPVVHKTLGESFAPKRVGKNKTKSHIVFILDGSASMAGIAEETVDGFNIFVQGQIDSAKETGIETTMSLYTFKGSSVDAEYVKRTASEECKIRNGRGRFNGGGTNLNDAIGAVMVQLNNDLATRQKSERESVILVILTDGLENSSRSFSTNDVKVMREAAEAKNWSFTFLGANMDAFAVAQSYGISADSTLSYAGTKSAEAFSSATRAVSDTKLYRSMGMSTMDTYTKSAFTLADRTDAQE